VATPLAGTWELNRTVTDAVNIWDEVPDFGVIGARKLARAP
jgi:hypothetical protein